MRNPKSKDSTTVIAISLPTSLVAQLPTKRGGRSKYVRALIRQDVIRRSESVLASRSPSTPSPPTRDGVRSLEDRLNAIHDIEQEIRDCTDRLASHLADLDAYLRRVRRVESVPAPMPQNAPGIAQSVDPFAALPDPDRPGKVRLKTNQDGTAQFEVVHPDTPSPLPAPQPMTRPSVARTRPEDL